MNVNTRIVELANQGKTNKEIAADVGWSHSTVRSFLMKNGIKRKKDADFDIEAAAERVRGGERVASVAKSLGIEKSVLRRRLVNFMGDYDVYQRAPKVDDVDMDSKKAQALRCAQRGVTCVHEIAYRVGGVSSDKIGEWLASSSA